MWIMAMRIQASLLCSRSSKSLNRRRNLPRQVKVGSTTQRWAPPPSGVAALRSLSVPRVCPSSLGTIWRTQPTRGPSRQEDPADKRTQPTRGPSRQSARPRKRAAQKARGPVAQSALVIAAVSPEERQAWETAQQSHPHQSGTVQSHPHQPSTVVVLDAGAMHHHGQDQAQGVHGDVTLAALDLLALDVLALVIAVGPPFCGVLTDWLPTGYRLATDWLSMIAAEGVGSRPSWTRTFWRRASWTRSIRPPSRQRWKWSQPAVEVVPAVAVGREVMGREVMGREVVGQEPPGTAGAGLVEDGVPYLVQGICARPPGSPAFGGGKDFLDRLPLGIGQITGPDHWPRSLAQITGPDHWPRSLAQITGPDHWPRSLA